MKQELRIRVTGKNDAIPVSSFTSIVRNTLDVLREVERSRRHGKKPIIRWCLHQLEMRSPALVVLRGIEDEKSVLDCNTGQAAQEAWRELQANTRPADFTDQAIMSSLRLGRELLNGISKIESSVSGDEWFEFNNQMAANASNLVELNSYYEWTSIVGTMEAVDVHANEPKFRLYNDEYPSGINCFFPQYMLRDVIGDFPETTDDLTHVEIDGYVKFSHAGRMMEVSVNSYEVISEPPSYRDEPSIDFTSGQDIHDYVRRVRYGEK